MAKKKRLIDVPMDENDANAETVGGFLKTLLLHLWEEGEGFSGKRPFGNSGWQFQVYASLIKAGYEIGKLDEYGDVDDVDYAKADKLIMDAISEVFTVDAVEVVRCKDCEYFKPAHFKADDGTEIPWDESFTFDGRSDGIYIGGKCKHERNTAYGQKDMAFRKPDHFCSYGERKDDGI